MDINIDDTVFAGELSQSHRSTEDFFFFFIEITRWCQPKQQQQFLEKQRKTSLALLLKKNCLFVCFLKLCNVQPYLYCSHDRKTSSGFALPLTVKTNHHWRAGCCSLRSGYSRNITAAHHGEDLKPLRMLKCVDWRFVDVVRKIWSSSYE